MKSLLLIIDLQNGFVNEHTKEISKKVNLLLDEKRFNDVIFTRYINSENNVCYKRLNYTECMSEESKAITIDTRGYKVIDKEGYTAVTDELKTYIKENNISKIYVCGIDTECCVLKTAYDLFEQDYDVYILSEYCACMAGNQANQNALELLKRNIGYNKVI